MEVEFVANYKNIAKNIHQMPLSGKYKIAAEKFLNEKAYLKYTKESKIVGILASGSVVNSKPNKNSDIDMHIVVNKGETRTRGNTFVNGVEIEYFINPVKQIKHYLKTETSKHTAHMFVNCEVLEKSGKTIDNLRKEAKKALNKKLSKKAKVWYENTKYAIDDELKNVEDLYLIKDKFGFSLAANEILIKSKKIFFAIKRSPDFSPKRSQKELKKLDPKFERLYSVALIETSMKKKYQTIKKLVEYIEKLLGGKRKKEWILTGKCVYD